MPTLNPRQIELVRRIHVGNAYMVLHVLKQTYGMMKSAQSTMLQFEALNKNVKQRGENVSDYIARVERMVHDLRGPTIDAAQHKYFILAGLKEQGEWKTIITLVSVMSLPSLMCITAVPVMSHVDVPFAVLITLGVDSMVTSLVMLLSHT